MDPAYNAAPTAPRGPSAMLKLFWTTVFGLMVAAWIIYLAGVAASQQACVDNGGTLVNPGRLLLSQEELGAVEGLTAGSRRMLLASKSETCSQSLSFAWWTVWFDVLCIAVAVASALMGGAHQNVAIIFMTMETVILMVVASQLNAAIFANKDKNFPKIKDIVAANRAAMAGNVMLMVFNFVYLIAATESTGTYTPVLGSFPLPAMPKLGGATNTTTATATNGDPAAKAADLPASHPPMTQGPLGVAPPVPLTPPYQPAPSHTTVEVVEEDAAPSAPPAAASGDAVPPVKQA